MRQLIAQVDCGRIAGGTHEPRVVVAGGEKYVVKRTQSENGNPSKEHGNEALANTLARQIGIPVLGWATIVIEPGFEWRADAQGYTSGIYFGSEYVESAWSPSVADLRKVAPDQLYQLFVFDVWLSNPDRKLSDLLSGEDSDKRLAAIDHSNILTGSHWWPEHLPRNYATLPDPVGEWLFWYRNDGAAARRCVETIMSAPLDLKAAIAEAAHFWELADSAAVFEFLNRRLENLAALVHENILKTEAGPKR